MEKFVYYNELYLIYKDLLNEKQREVFDLYYGDNLSMQEIADELSISKSRIGVIIKDVEKRLDNYENNLRILSRNKKLNDLLNESDLLKIKKEIENIIKGE